MALFRCCLAPKGAAKTAPLTESPVTSAKSACTAKQGCLVSLQNLATDPRAASGAASGNGTGVLLGPNLVLTSHDTISSREQAARGEVQVVVSSGSGGKEFLERRRILPERFFVTDPEYDVTIVACESAGGLQGVTPIVLEDALAVPEADTASGRFVHVIGRPADVADLEGDHLAVIVGQGKIKSVDGPFLKFASNGEAWAPGSAAFDDKGRFVFLVCGPSEGADASSPKGKKVASKPRRSGVQSGTTARGIIHWLGEQGFKDMGRLGQSAEPRSGQGLEGLAPSKDEAAPPILATLKAEDVAGTSKGSLPLTGKGDSFVVEPASEKGSPGLAEVDSGGQSGTAEPMSIAEAEQGVAEGSAGGVPLAARLNTALVEPESGSEIGTDGTKGTVTAAALDKEAVDESHEAVAGPSVGSVDAAETDGVPLPAEQANGRGVSALPSEEMLRGQTELDLGSTGVCVEHRAAQTATQVVIPPPTGVSAEERPGGKEPNGSVGIAAVSSVDVPVVGAASLSEIETRSPLNEEKNVDSASKEVLVALLAKNQSTEPAPGGGLKPVSTGGSSPQSKTKGTGNSPKSRGSPQANGRPKSGSGLKVGGARSVSSGGSSAQGGGKDTERDQKMIKHLQKQARRAAAAKPATGGETCGGPPGQLSRKGSGRLKDGVSESKGSSVTPATAENKVEKESKPASEALTLEEAAAAAVPAEPAVVAKEAERSAAGFAEGPTVKAGTPETNGGSQAPRSADEATIKPPSGASSRAERAESSAHDEVVQRPTAGAEIGAQKTETLLNGTEANWIPDIEERRESAALRLKEAWGTGDGERRGSKDGAADEKSGTEPELGPTEPAGGVENDLEIGGDRFLQFSMSVAAAKESFEKLAKRDEKSPEPQRKLSSLSSQRGRTKSEARRSAEEATRGRRRTRGAVDTSPIVGEERMHRTGSLHRLRKTAGEETEIPLPASLKVGKKPALKPPPGMAWKAKVAEERNGTSEERNGGGAKKAVILGRGLVPMKGTDSAAKRRSGDELWAARKGLSTQGSASVSGDAAAPRTLSISDIDLDSDSDASEKGADAESELEGEEAWPAERNEERTEKEQTTEEPTESDVPDGVATPTVEGRLVEVPESETNADASGQILAEPTSILAESAPTPDAGNGVAANVAANSSNKTASDNVAETTAGEFLEVPQSVAQATELLESAPQTASAAAASSATAGDQAEAARNEAEAVADVIADVIGTAQVSRDDDGSAGLAAGGANGRPGATGSDPGGVGAESSAEASGKGAAGAARTLRMRSFSATSGPDASATLAGHRIEGFGRQTIDAPKPRAKTTEDKIRTAQAKLKSNVPVLGPVLGLGLEMGLQLEKRTKREEDVHGLKKATKFKVKKVTPLEVPGPPPGQEAGGLSPATRGRELRPGVYESAAQSPPSPKEAGSPKFIPEVLIKVTHDISRGVNKVTHDISQGVKGGVKVVTELPGIKEGLGIIMEPIKKAEEEKKEAERKRLEAAAAKERAAAEGKQGRLDRLKVNDANEAMRDIKASILGLNFGGKKRAAMAGFNDPDLDADTDDAAARAAHRANLERRVLGSFSGLLANTETLTRLTQASVEERDRKPEHDLRRLSHLWPGHVAPRVRGRRCRRGCTKSVRTFPVRRFVRRTGEMTLQQQAELLWHGSQDAATDPYERLAGESPETDENLVAPERRIGSSAANPKVSQSFPVDVEKGYRVTEWQDDYWKKRMAGFRHENSW